MNKKNIFMVKIGVCLVFSLLIYFLILARPESIVSFSERNNYILYPILFQIIIISYTGAIFLDDIKGRLFENPKLILNFMDILVVQLYIFSVIYLISNLSFIKYVDYLNTYFGKYQIVFQCAALLFMFVKGVLKNKSIDKKSILSILIFAMIIFNSNLFELIFIILYFTVLYLFERIIDIKRGYIYDKISKSIAIILFFTIILYMYIVKIEIIDLLSILLIEIVIGALYWYLIKKVNNYRSDYNE